jgi:hypothetical protein
VLVFSDDILIYSQSLEDHVIHLGEVLQLLRRDQWRVNMSKCAFATREISYLGYVISSRGVSTCPDVCLDFWPCPGPSCFLSTILY